MVYSCPAVSVHLFPCSWWCCCSGSCWHTCSKLHVAVIIHKDLGKRKAAQLDY